MTDMADIRRTGRFWKPEYEPHGAKPRPIMRERDLQAAVVEMAGWLGWKDHHQKYSIQSAKGWPDLVLCKPPRLLFVELKSDGKEPTASQVLWLDALRQCGVEVTCWHVTDWKSGEIERVLRGGRVDDASATNAAL